MGWIDEQDRIKMELKQALDEAIQAHKDAEILTDERDRLLLQVRDYCATTERQQEVINGLLKEQKDANRQIEVMLKECVCGAVRDNLPPTEKRDDEHGPVDLSNEELNIICGCFCHEGMPSDQGCCRCTEVKT